MTPPRAPQASVTWLSFWSMCAALTMTLIQPAPAAAQSGSLAPPWPGGWSTTVRADHPDVGRIQSEPTGADLTPAQAVAQLATADVVLLGEQHDNADHHQAQAWLLQALVETGRHPAVVMEMLDSGQTEALADYLSRPNADAQGLGPAVDWQESGWPEWSMYQPIATVALKAGLPILPGNLPISEVRRIAQEGAEAVLSPDGLAPRGLDVPLPQDLRASLGQEILESHCNMLPKQAVPPMIEAQRARDGEMARALLAALARPDTDGAVLIAGNGHVRTDRGVPWVLRHLSPEVSTASVGLLEVPPKHVPPEQTSSQASPQLDTAPDDDAASPPPFTIVWWTPAADDEDPCAKFAVQLERLRARHGNDAAQPPGPSENE